MALPKSSKFMPLLREHRRDTARRRAKAFSDVPEYVLGTPVLPLTPRTFSMLVAIGSPIVHGGTPLEGDIRNYLWFHSPLYANCEATDGQRRKRRALRKFTWMISRPWLPWIGKAEKFGHYAASLTLAVSEILQIKAEAFADAVEAKDDDAAPNATLEAELVATFAAELGWPPERTRNTPLAQLFQLYRVLLVRRGASVTDKFEDNLLAAHLKDKLAEIEAKQAAAEAVNA